MSQAAYFEAPTNADIALTNFKGDFTRRALCRYVTKDKPRGARLESRLEPDFGHLAWSGPPQPRPYLMRIMYIMLNTR